LIQHLIKVENFILSTKIQYYFLHMSTVNTQQIYQQAKDKGQCIKAFIQDTMKPAI